MSNEEIIRKVFYNPDIGFGGLEKTYKTLKKMGHNIKREEIAKFLKKQEVVQINKKNTGKQGSFVPPYPLYEFQVDLIHLDNTHLNKASYGLVCIDAFSKKGHVELLKRKSAPEVAEAMQKILDKMGTPEYVYCDDGSEFTSHQFKKLMKDNNIEPIFTIGHAPMVERFNRTLKELLSKYLQSTNSKTITNVLPKILNNYNNSYHKTIRMAPNEVNEKNQGDVYLNILSKATVKKRENINIGDKVRVLLKRKSFTKGYKPKWSKQIYEVENRDGKYYTIKGLDRKYLRAFIQKIGEVEQNVVPPDLEGTREGNLKKLAYLPVDESSYAEKSRLEEELATAPIAKTKAVRVKKKPKKYQDIKSKPEQPKVWTTEELQKYPELIDLLLKLQT